MTSERVLEGKRILVLEDDYYMATDEKGLLEQAGARVVGPLGRSSGEGDLPGAGEVDGAVVDINLGQGPSFELARVLERRGIPFVFVTGYDAAIIPEGLAHAPRLEKPIHERELVEALARVVGGASG